MNNRRPGGRRTKNDNQAGFTLLEVLLSMAILAVILTAIYASFSTAGNNVDRAEKLRDETDTARTLIARLSTDIANAYAKGVPTPPFESSKEVVLGETGKAGETIRHDSINMTTLTNVPRPDSKETELWAVGYFFREKPEGKGYILFRREKRELSKDVPPLQGGEEYELTDLVESMQFRFMDTSGAWTDNGWNQGAVLPRAVEIVIVLNTGKIYTTRVDVGNSSA